MLKSRILPLSSVLLAALLSACIDDPPPHPDRPHYRGDVLQRVPSPNSELVAVVTRHSYGGAAGGVDDYVYLEGNRGPEQVLYSPDNEEIELVWLSEDRLRIRLRCGRVNFWNVFDHYDESDNWVRRVQIELVTGGVCPDDLPQPHS